jgi:hypothetical protein
MIALLSILDLILPVRVKNLAILLLLLAFGVYFGVSDSNKKVSSHYNSSVILNVPDSPDFPLSIPLSTKEESSGIGGDLSEGDENLINLASFSLFVSESIYFNQQNNSPIQESLHPPFTPPESVTLNRM